MRASFARAGGSSWGGPAVVVVAPVGALGTGFAQKNATTRARHPVGAFCCARVIARLRRRSNLSGYPFVSLWSHDAPPASPALLIFEVAALPTAAEGDGVLLGEFEPNGALCLLVDSDERVWPIYNPRPPAFNAQRR